MTIADKTRLNIVRTARDVGSVHFGGTFSVVEILEAFYAPIVENRQSFQEFVADNLLILSKGHCGLAVYSMLAVLKVISQEQLSSYCKEGGKFIGHIKKDDHLGIGWSTGSLGHGLSISMGIATAYRKLKINRRVLCILGDGEMHEGANWEALLHLSHDSDLPLTIILDNNKFLSLGRTQDIRPLEPVQSKIECFHVPCVSIDGQNSKSVSIALEQGKLSGRAFFINANTMKGHGVSFTRGESKWHAKRATDEELLLMEAELMGRSI
jgi:transketolase